MRTLEPCAVAHAGDSPSTATCPLRRATHERVPMRCNLRAHDGALLQEDARLALDALFHDECSSTVARESLR
eukprot:3052645-Alexandrium_andersonii.AAC.1